MGHDGVIIGAHWGLYGLTTRARVISRLELSFTPCAFVSVGLVFHFLTINLLYVKTKYDAELSIIFRYFYFDVEFSIIFRSLILVLITEGSKLDVANA